MNAWNHDGTYESVYMPSHPRARKGCVLRHILVAEAILGRPLRPGEVVHHRNGDGTDNRRLNIVVLASQGDHYRKHWNKMSSYDKWVIIYVMNVARKIWWEGLTDRNRKAIVKRMNDARLKKG